RRVKGDMRRFKEFIESRDGRETGAWRGEVHRPGT
ncbi:MAG: SRPBCC family protein, partial [Pseudonocardiaceae bacterium]